MAKAKLHGAAAGLGGPLPEVQERVCELLRGGMSLYEASRYIGVTYQTAYGWRAKYPAFAAACAEAEAERDAERQRRKQEIDRLLAEGSAASAPRAPAEQDQRPQADQAAGPEPVQWPLERCARGEHRSSRERRFTCVGCGVTKSMAMPLAEDVAAQ